MTQEGFKRKLTAILSADVEGYSRLMGEDEGATIRTLTTYRSVIAKLVQQYRGRVVDSPGDNILSEFASAVDAVNCAVEIQRELADRNAGLPSNRKMEFRIGVNVGDVVQEEERIYGDGVNIAARVESMSQAGGICISGRAYDQVSNKLGLEYENLGKHEVKNISTPIRIYRIIMESDLSKRFASEQQTALPLPDKPSIAVLPFNNMSGDPEQEYFSDGITEDIITALSRSPSLIVISRNSTFTYKDSAVDIRTVSRELGVQHILEGSVRKVGKRVRITAQLINGTTGSHIWAEKYDGELQDIFDFQDQITQQVVASVQTQIFTHIDKKVKAPEYPNVGTWDLLAQGVQFFYEMTSESLAAAEKMFRRALESAPESCEANFLLAGALIHQVLMGYVSDTTAIVSEAFEIAKRAVSLNENNEFAHLFLGIIQYHRGEKDGAIAELEHAIEINPNCSHAYGVLGNFLSESDPDESIKNNEIAIRINPRNPSIFFRYSGLASAHFAAGRYSEALQWARKCIHRKPGWREGHALFISSLAQLNRLEEAKEAVLNYLEHFPDETISCLKKLQRLETSDYAHRLEEGLRKAGFPE